MILDHPPITIQHVSLKLKDLSQKGDFTSEKGEFNNVNSINCDLTDLTNNIRGLNKPAGLAAKKKDLTYKTPKREMFVGLLTP